MTESMELRISMQLSHEIDDLSDIEADASPGEEVFFRSDGLDDSAFSPVVRRETDLLLSAAKLRLDEASRNAMLRAGERAMAARTPAANPLRTLDLLMEAINAVPDVDDELFSLQPNSGDVFTAIERKRQAADTLARLLDAVATGKMTPADADADLSSIVDTINNSDISKELAFEGISVAASHSPGMERRLVGGSVKGVSSRSASLHSDAWSSVLQRLRTALGV